jgi:hypothetical protein
MTVIKQCDDQRLLVLDLTNLGWQRDLSAVTTP